MCTIYQKLQENIIKKKDYKKHIAIGWKYSS